MSTDFLANYSRYKHNPWDFLTECVFTLDQVDRENAVKLLPDREYGELYARVWQSYPLMAIPKSRRMTMSWYTIALYLWDTLFHSGRFNAFVSKKEDDADELVKRAIHILENIPADKLPKEILPHWNSKFCLLEFPEIKSKIQGFPQGADQLRQFTFSGIFGDESAFWEKAKEFYSASFPTIEGGGRMTLVSSPAPGFFKKLCFDALDEPGDISVEEFAPGTKQHMPGVRTWANKKNKFLVFELHYTADPAKRDPAFRESIKNSMPIMEYLREYELHWDTFEGFPVYPEFSKLHCAVEKPFPVAGLPMVIAFDFGLTPAAVVGQFQDQTLYIFKEFVEVNKGAKQFLEHIVPQLRMLYPTFSDLKKDWLCFIDPAGLGRDQSNDQASCALEVGKYFVPAPGPINFEDRRKAVVTFLQGMTKAGPKFQLWAQDCQMLLKGFEGGYHFAEKHAEIEPTKLRPLKNAFSHPHDALQYLCHGINGAIARVKRTIPRPAYSTSTGAVRNG